MAGTYFTGSDNVYCYSAGQGSLDNNVNGTNSNTFSQNEIHGQDALSPVLSYRHDSMTSPSHSTLAQFPFEQHQAANQPCTAAERFTPQPNRMYSHQTNSMSRGLSRISDHSSTSSGHHQRGNQSHNPQDTFENRLPSHGVHMMRSVSDTPVFQSYTYNPRYSGFQPYETTTTSFTSPSINAIHTSISTIAQYSPSVTEVDDTLLDVNWSSLAGLNAFGNESEGFGQTATEYARHSATLAPTRPRPRAASSGHHPMLHPFSFKPVRLPNHESAYVASSVSPSPGSPEASSSPKKRRRHNNPGTDSEPEVVTGHVLASGKFKCSDAECADLRFGRQADFRRHYTNVHAPEKTEYFCTHRGCERSKRPFRKGKGRSFGSRRDKMEEHVRIVHEKESSKRKRNAPRTENDEDGEESQEAVAQVAKWVKAGR